MSTRLIPPQTELTQPYWEAAANQQLLVQLCDDCRQHQFPPRAHCAACGSANLSWQAVSGKGTVYTYTVAHRPPHPVLVDQCPLIIAVVELAEGPRMMSNVVDCDPRDLQQQLTLASRNMLLDMDDRAGGTRPMADSPYRFSDAAAGVRGPAAHQGEHNQDVLQDWLKMSHNDIQRLVAVEILKTASRPPG